MQVVLVMFRADGERRSFSVVRDMTVIGRREDCDLRIPLGDVSRKHCRLIKDGHSVRLEDLGSSNGTYHNGQRVQEATLSPGDTLQIGPVNFMVQIDGVPADEDMQAALPTEAPAAEAVSQDPAPAPEATGTPAATEEPAAAAPEGENFEVSGEEVQPAEQADDLVEFDFDEEPSAKDKPA